MRHFIFLVFAAASAIAQQSAVSNQQSAHGKPGFSATAEKQGGAAASPTTAAAVPHEYEPSELQKLKLENAQLKVIVIGLQIQPLEQKRHEQLAALSQLCEAVVRENHWPENVKCDPATLKFQAETPKAERQPIPARPASSTDPRQ